MNAYMKNIIRYIPSIINETKDLKISNKGAYRDLITECDKKIEEYLRDSILKKYPNHTILGEESYDRNRDYDKSNLWLIDPIDGTTNFVKQGSDYCTIISYFENDEPILAYIYDVVHDDLYSAIKGKGFYKNDEKVEAPKDKSLKDSLVSLDLRRMQYNRPNLFNFLIKQAFSIRVVGSSGLDGLKVAMGDFGAYLHFNAGPWDFSPFFLIANELGLVFTDFNGKTPNPSKYSPFIIACPSAYNDIMQVL